MEDSLVISYIALSLIFLIFALKLLPQTKTHLKNTPPSPPSLPIIGHLHLLKHPVHRTLQKLSQKHGSIIALHFGSKPVVIISSLSAAEECFTKNDIILANRPRLLSGKHLGYNHMSMITSSYGDHWRNLRRICMTDVFSSTRLNSFAGIRREEVKRLLKKLSKNSLHEFSKVELQSMFSDLTMNIMMRMVTGKRLSGDDESDEKEVMRFQEMLKELTKTVGAANPGDYLPFLDWISFNAREKKMIRLAKRVDAFLQGLVDEHRSKKKDGRNTMIDHLLSLQESQPDLYSDEIIKGLISDIILAGTETSSVTLEWALSNLLNHPQTLKKARDELDSQIGQEQLLNEADVSKLPYLNGIIAETLRLYPAAPLLLPHFTSDNCTIGGYNVSRDTMVIANAWAIHRDPNLWDEPTSFKPERHSSSSGGSDKGVKKLIPFGLGRRACPGAGMAQRVLGLGLGFLIQCFEWERPSEKEIDMNEGIGATMPRAVPLELMCKARPVMSKVLVEEIDCF